MGALAQSEHSQLVFLKLTDLSPGKGSTDKFELVFTAMTPPLAFGTALGIVCGFTSS